MPGGFRLSSGLGNALDPGLSLTNSYGGGVTATPSASANTKGAWVQLIASTLYHTNFIMLRGFFNSSDAGVSTMLTDIGIGGAGSELVVIPNLFSKAAQFNNLIFNTLLPLEIPPGTRVAIRTQSNGASSANGSSIGMTLYSGDWMMPDGVAGYDDINVLVGSPPNSVAIQPTTNATKTGWTQINAATARDYCGILVMVDNQGVPDNTNFPLLVVDIGIGAGGSEVNLIPSITSPQNISSPVMVSFVPVHVKAGSRLSVRMALSTVTSTFKGGVALYGAYH